MKTRTAGRKYVFVFGHSPKMSDIVYMLVIIQELTASIHGMQAKELTGVFSVDTEKRTCTVDTTTRPGLDFARIFATFALYIYGAGEVGIKEEVIK